MNETGTWENRYIQILENHCNTDLILLILY
jgi:hypothetical protein